MSKLNPYEPADTSNDETPDGSLQRSIIGSALSGAAWAVVATIPLAGLIGLVFRFPIPFNGYMSGPTALVMAMFAAVFYGLAFGGWLIVGTLGGVLSVTARLTIRNDPSFKTVSRFMSIVVAVISCLILATLDWYIGAF